MERRGFREKMGMRMRGAYLSMHRRFNAHFLRFGATADQFVVLTLLAEEDGITQQELADRVFSDPNTVTVMLALLENRGFIRRRADDGDRRVRRVCLTARGRAFQEKLDLSAEALHRQLRNALPPAHRRLVLEALKRIAEVMVPTTGGRRQSSAGRDFRARSRRKGAPKEAKS
jgi:DNA-binding MarR family transcriptional regulator